MKRSDIEANLRALGRRLLARGVTGEILIVGGAYMLLILANREATRDIDAYFAKEPEAIRAAAAEVAKERGLPGDWLNDAVKGFMRQRPRSTDLWASYPGLRIYVPDPEYIFAMKAEAVRIGSSDIDDLKALIRTLKLKTVDQALAIVERYVPSGLRSMKTQLTLEAIFEDLGLATPSPVPWVTVRLSKAANAKPHLAGPRSRVTLCGRGMRAANGGSHHSDDPRSVLGADLCVTCHRAWVARDR